MAEIQVYGVIHDTFADELRRDIARMDDHEPIELYINSPGGRLDQGVAAYNLLARAKNEVLEYVDGDAFSAATLLVCAAGYAEMPSNALMMIHEPWVHGVMPGTIDELEKATKYLKATKRQALQIYKEKTGHSQAKLAKQMKDETYFTAEEALSEGYISNVTEPSRSVQNCALDKYPVRDTERLASMLGQRRILADVETLLARIQGAS